MLEIVFLSKKKYILFIIIVSFVIVYIFEINNVVLFKIDIFFYFK